MDEAKQIGLAPLARLLGISERRAREHAANGVFVRAARGFDRDASVKAYGRVLRKAATGRRGDGDPTISRERARLARLQADAVEIRNKIACKDLISVAETEATWSEVVRITRDAILSAPARINADLPHLTPFDVSTIDRHLREALTRIADGPP